LGIEILAGSRIQAVVVQIESEAWRQVKVRFEGDCLLFLVQMGEQPAQRKLTREHLHDQARLTKNIGAQPDRHLKSRWRLPFKSCDVAVPEQCALNPAKNL